MRVAAIYDIHGNLPALDAVLAEIDESGVEGIVVGGDVAWGPLPRETVERLAALGRRALRLTGDADRDVVESLAAEPDPGDPTATASRWCAEQLDEPQLAALVSSPETWTLEIDGLGPVLFCHGSPRSDRDRITAGSPDERVLGWLEGVKEQVVVCGHTHAQFDRLFGGYRVVNPGAVGLQFGERGAYWAILGPEVELRRTDYDYEEAARRFRAAGGPLAEPFAERVLDPPPAETAVERWG